MILNELLEKFMEVTGNTGELQIRSDFEKTLSKQITTRRVLITLGVLCSLAILGPLVWLAVKTGIGLIAAGTLGLCGFFAWRRIPFWIQQHENSLFEANQREMNEHLKRLKQEARRNPIEQLQNFLTLKEQQLKAYKNFVSQVGGQVKSAKDMLDDRKKQKPDKDYRKKDEAVLSMDKAYAFHLSKVEAGNKALADLREAIEDANFDWKFSQAGQLAMQKMQDLEGQDILNEILASESFDAVRNNFNQVFSEIEVQIGTINSGNQLEFGENVSINLSAYHIPSMEELINVGNWTNQRKTQQFCQVDRKRSCCITFCDSSYDRSFCSWWIIIYQQ